MTHYDFPDETAAPEEIQAAVRADPVVNAWRLMNEVGPVWNRARELRAGSRIRRHEARRLREVARLARLWARSS